MNLPKLTELKLAKKRALVRVDFDVPLAVEQDGTVGVGDETRLESALKTVEYLIKEGAGVVVVAHLGRPGGRRNESLSLRPVARSFSSLLRNGVRVGFFPHAMGKGAARTAKEVESGEVLILENLRFYEEEEQAGLEFTKELASLAHFFVNEAFAVSHREHASIVGVPRYLPSAFGFRFLREVEVLSRVYEKPERPVVLILGGRKKGKLEAGEALLGWADKVLVGGELVESERMAELAKHKKVVADLTRKGEDITLQSAREFAQIIMEAGTVVWSGPMGAYEMPRYLKGTEVVAKAVVRSKAFSVIGGGDTEAALTRLDLVDKVDHICSGGGAMLSFLALRESLPGIKAVLEREKK